MAHHSSKKMAAYGLKLTGRVCQYTQCDTLSSITLKCRYFVAKDGFRIRDRGLTTTTVYCHRYMIRMFAVWGQE